MLRPGSLPVLLGNSPGAPAAAASGLEGIKTNPITTAEDERRRREASVLHLEFQSYGEIAFARAEILTDLCICGGLATAAARTTPPLLVNTAFSSSAEEALASAVAPTAAAPLRARSAAVAPTAAPLLPVRSVAPGGTPTAEGSLPGHSAATRLAHADSTLDNCEPLPLPASG